MLFLFNEMQISGGVFCNLANKYLVWDLTIFSSLSSQVSGSTTTGLWWDRPTLLHINTNTLPRRMHREMCHRLCHGRRQSIDLWCRWQLEWNLSRLWRCFTFQWAIKLACIRNVRPQYLAIIEWGWVGYEEFCRSRRVLSTEAKGRGG